MRHLFALGALLLCVAPSWAQVYKCTDATGKTGFSDTPCSTAAAQSSTVMGAGATERDPEAEAFAAERNLASIQRSRAALAGSVDIVTRQSQVPAGAGGPVVMDAPPIQQTRSMLNSPTAGDECQTYSTRKGCIGGSREANPNWSARRGYYGGGGPADQEYEREQAALRARQPGQMVNCDRAGCYGANNGVRYNFTGGKTMMGTNGSACTMVGGNMVSCN